jgi:hypothetical protein
MINLNPQTGFVILRTGQRLAPLRRGGKIIAGKTETNYFNGD